MPKTSKLKKKVTKAKSKTIKKTKPKLASKPKEIRRDTERRYIVRVEKA